MSNPLHPDRLTSAERLAELASILAVGVIRLMTLMSSGKTEETGESSLDFGANQSGGGENR